MPNDNTHPHTEIELMRAELATVTEMLTSLTTKMENLFSMIGDHPAPQIPLGI